MGPFPPGERRPSESGGQKAAHGGLFFLAPLLGPHLALRQGSGLVHRAGGTWDPRTPSTQGRPAFTSRSTASEARVLSLDIYFS